MKIFRNHNYLSGPMLILLCISLLATLVAGCGDTPAKSGTQNDTPIVAKTSAHPIALIYRGPAGCDGCSEAAAALLQSSKWGFEVHYVGPDESLQLSEATLKTATLYVQPGGNGTVEQAFASLQPDAALIQNFVASGGRYLGLCMGGYLAGRTPGFNILPGDTDQYITSRGASVTTEADTIIQINWHNQPRSMYFQDGPYFILDGGAGEVSTLATYTNGKIAVLVAPYGKGKVGVTGPHPEATPDWYTTYHLTDPNNHNMDMGHDLVDTLMQ